LDNLTQTVKDVCNLLGSDEGREKAIVKIMDFKGDPKVTRYYLIQVLIDHGQEIDSYELVECALLAFERIKSKAPSDPLLYYNVGNGYQLLYDWKVRADPTAAFDCQDVVVKAIKYFGKAPADDPRVLTNLGSLYDSIGRPVEAIDQYERALAIDENFGMALGNKACAVQALSHISGYPVTYLIYAHQLYESAIDVASTIIDVGGEVALHFFQDSNNEIVRRFADAGKVKLLETDLRHEHYDIAGRGEFVEFYTDFCVKHDLYLNLHLYDRTAQASVGDAVVPTLVTRVDDGSATTAYFRDIAFRLNEVYESYMTARVSLVQSQYTNDDFSAISEQTTLINTTDYAVSNIYVGYLKAAYKEAFSALDKIAVLLNHYLKIGHPEDSVYYGTVWYEHSEDTSDKASPVIAPAVKEQGYRLLGLYLLCCELRGSKYSSMRNALTHRYARVFRHVRGPRGTRTFEELTDLTVDVMYKVKCAILYATLFIEQAESTKRANLTGPIGVLQQSIEQHLDTW
jgi:tetratricopeptide (TPR) repeat protein